MKTELAKDDFFIVKSKEKKKGTTEIQIKDMTTPLGLMQSAQYCLWLKSSINEANFSKPNVELF